jgi:UDP-N-acetylglucosamine 4,6-dehydratase
MKILVTGGSGTLAKALLVYNPDHEYTLFARNESRLAVMKSKFPWARTLIGDVRDYERLEAACAGHDVVIHGAAMKRLPECEAEPRECYLTNVQGSLNVIRACQATGVKRCIGISTDKACQAVTAYGASKLMMERLFAAQSSSPTLFTTVRYGNVISSNGSVIPIWREQRKQYRPLTITDPCMTRFWMSPRDAVTVVQEALKTTMGGLTLVSKPKALSVLETVWALFGEQAETETIGLRSHEKLHEALVHPDEPVFTPYDEGKTSSYAIAPGGIMGYAYTSADCPRLAKDEFVAMLREAEELERI